MNDIDVVIDKLIAGEVFFFAGSGISYASNLPSAYAVLEHTANIYLPATISDKEKKDICSKIQPEVFYESIIGMTHSYESLDIWRSLYRTEQEKHRVFCVPNFSHLFIVKYSIKNNHPIITTNFDSMFEQACDLLNIPYRIVLPTDQPPHIDATRLSICKVHGSVQDYKGEYSPHALWTTMTQITKVNTKWIEYLNGLMKTKHLCFVGYSGRDIDFFPYIAELPKKSGAKKIIWINNFIGDHSDVASKSCDAIRVCLWPSDLFKSILGRTNIEVPAQKQEWTHESGDIEELLTYLEKSLSQKNLLSDAEKELLYCGLLAKLGYYREAHQYATEIATTKLSQFSRPSSKYHLLLTCARLSHEISKYESCKKYASQALVMLKSNNQYDINTHIQAGCLVSESYRMSIPNDIYFIQPKKLLDYAYVFFVLAHFAGVFFMTKIRLGYHKLRYSDLSTETQHELIENSIRFYALIQSIIGSPHRDWNRFAKAYLIKIWDGIRDTSYNAGYAAGIANSGKFKYRLNPLEKTKSESANIYALTTSATGMELLLRNEADQLLCVRKYDESRARFIEYADMAKKSGNALNEVKGIIGFAYANHIEGKTPLLTDVLKKRFFMVKSQVEGRRWKDHFAYIAEVIKADGECP